MNEDPKDQHSPDLPLLPATTSQKKISTELIPLTAKDESAIPVSDQWSEEDEQDWELITQGDADAFARIHDRYYTGVFKCALDLIKSREIATQIWIESFAEVWLMREEFTGIELKEFFMVVITKREIKETRELLNEWTSKQDRKGIGFKAWAESRKLSDMTGKKWWVKWNIPFLYDRWKEFYDAG